VKPALIAATVAGAMSACSLPPAITTTPLATERTYPPTPSTAAIPLYAVAKPECPFDEIALITAEAQGSGDAVLASLRDKAREIGGQAIIGYTQSERRGSDQTRSGTAIRFRSADCTK
jgi:hypothetical protein